MIHLVRHGEAAMQWGAHPDPGLSPEGRNQARATAEILLSAGPIQHCFTSPMQRCQETAKAFTDRSGLTIHIADQITEIPTPLDISDRRSWLQTVMAGTWDGTPTLVQDWHKTLLNFVTRAPDNSVLFTHYIAINAIVGTLDKNPAVLTFSPGHASITTLRRCDDRLVALLGEDGDAGIIL